MKITKMLGFLCLLILTTAFANRATFDNYQVHRVVPENQEQLNNLKDLEDGPNGVCILYMEGVFIRNNSEIVNVIYSQI